MRSVLLELAFSRFALHLLVLAEHRSHCVILPMGDSIKYDKGIRLPLRIPAPAVSFLECYFEFVPPAEKADVFACLFHHEPVPGWRSYEGATRLIDLRASLDGLLADCTKGTRYEISRASARDGIETSVVSDPTEVQLDEFMNYYDEFAATKGVPNVRRPQLRALRSTGKVMLSFARGMNETILASHAYVVSRARARLTHSASLFRLEHASASRAEIGRANRLLHWNDLVTFRTMGADWYDFGGWYEGSDDEGLLRVNSFKKEFGGEIAKDWSSFDSGSVLGTLYLTVRDLKLRRTN